MQKNFTKTRVKFQNHNFFLEDVMSWTYCDGIGQRQGKKGDEYKYAKGLIIQLANGMNGNTLVCKGPKTLENKFTKVMDQYRKAQLADPKNKHLIEYP